MHFFFTAHLLPTMLLYFREEKGVFEDATILSFNLAYTSAHKNHVAARIYEIYR